MKYKVRYFLNSKQECHPQHEFEYDHAPLVPRIGENVCLDYFGGNENDTYDDMSEHWYEVTSSTYDLSGGGDYVLIDVDAVDVTDEVMEEEGDDDFGLECNGCCKGCH